MNPPAAGITLRDSKVMIVFALYFQNILVKPLRNLAGGRIVPSYSFAVSVNHLYKDSAMPAELEESE